MSNINNKIGERITYAVTQYLFLTKTKTINIGNITKIYLGRAENVPVDMVMAKFIKAKII